MVQSLNTEEIYTWTPRLMAAIRGLPEVIDVSTTSSRAAPAWT
jgi:hypothetical protein